MAGNSTLAERLSDQLDDVEAVVRQIAERMVAPKPADGQRVGLHELFRLYEAKQSVFENTLSDDAVTFARRQSAIERLQAELDKRNDSVDRLRTALKSAELTLTSAIFQANQKLKSIKESEKNKVCPEELIKFAHRISQTNAVAAPLFWQQGAPERPFPTGAEMRKGWLGCNEEERRVVGQSQPTEATADAHGNYTGAVAVPPMTARAANASSPRSATPPYSQGVAGIPGPAMMMAQRIGTSPRTALMHAQHLQRQQPRAASPYAQHMAAGSPSGGRFAPYDAAVVAQPPPYPGRPMQSAVGRPALPFGAVAHRAVRTPLQMPARPAGSPILHAQLQTAGQASPRLLSAAAPPMFPPSSAQLAQRRPSASSASRTATPPAAFKAANAQASTARAVDTHSSDSSSSSSSDSPA